MVDIQNHQKVTTCQYNEHCEVAVQITSAFLTEQCTSHD